jgi:hypothetical protein
LNNRKEWSKGGKARLRWKKTDNVKDKQLAWVKAF